jgi:hypothetical protein
MVAAKDLNTKTLSAFGLEKQPVKDAAGIAEHEKKQSETVRVIQSDLEAYYARKPEMHFKNGHRSDEGDAGREGAAHTLGDQAAVNLSGSSMVGRGILGGHAGPLGGGDGGRQRVQVLQLVQRGQPASGDRAQGDEGPA